MAQTGTNLKFKILRNDFLLDGEGGNYAKIMIVGFSPRGDARRAEGLK